MSIISQGLNEIKTVINNLEEKDKITYNDLNIIKNIKSQLLVHQKNCNIIPDLIEKCRIILGRHFKSSSLSQIINIGELDIFQFPIDNKAKDSAINSRLIQITEMNKISGQQRLPNGLCKYENKNDFQSCDNISFKYIKKSIDDLKKYGAKLLQENRKDYFGNFSNSLKKTLDDNSGSSKFYLYALELLFLPEVNDNIECSKIKFNPKAAIEGSMYDLNSIYTRYIPQIQKIYQSRINNFDKHIIRMKDESNKCYATKLELPSNSRIIVFGDFHASIHTLIRSLIRMKRFGYLVNNEWKLRDNFYIFFLGDFVDRGLYGWEVWFIIMKLLISNPTQVFITRGNHEEYDTNTRYGFLNELMCKFGNNKGQKLHNVINDIWRIYIPSAIFIKLRGIDGWMQFCHGGFDRNLDSIKDYLETNSQKFYPPFDDFMWSDFKCGGKEVQTEYNNYTNVKYYGIPNTLRGAGRVYNYATAKYYMEKSNIYSVFRGHQDQDVNTKILMFEDSNCNYQNLAYLKDVKNNVGKRSKSIDLWKIELYNNINVQEYKNYLPIFTFSTAVSPRHINDDGFGVIYLEPKNNNKNIGGLSGIALPSRK